jgi:thymidine kinase
MFAGKTTALIDRLQSAAADGRIVVAIKPARDDRYAADHLASHAGARLDALSIESAAQLRTAAGAADVVGIDEVHFFDAAIAAACLQLAAAGRDVVVAGVDLDHRGEVFPAVAALEQIADRVTRLVAPCARCGAPAQYTQRLIASDDPIVVGGAGDYEPRCGRCFERRR